MTASHKLECVAMVTILDDFSPEALGAGVAGLSSVATVPEARRQGIGTAVTLHLLEQARAMGYRIGVLFSSDMAVGVYRKLGFREYRKGSFYVWTANPSTAIHPLTTLLPTP